MKVKTEVFYLIVLSFIAINLNFNQEVLSAQTIESVTSRDLSAPKDIKLDGLERNVEIASPMGTVHIRWPRSVETVFGKTPERAVLSAMTAIKKTLYSTGFPMEVVNTINSWEMVFIDEKLPSDQIPTYLQRHCHPAWMMPPSNLYFVAQRIVAGCGEQRGQIRLDKSSADKELIKVLLHEMGHAIEFHLLKRNQNIDIRMAEGFATWFTSITAPATGMFGQNEISDIYKSLSIARLDKYGTSTIFYGDDLDYAFSSLPYYFISNKKKAGEVWQLYKNTPTPFQLSETIVSKYRYKVPSSRNEIEEMF